MGRYELLATAALTFNIASFFTLIRKVHLTKNTISLPWYYVIGNIVSQILLFTYGYINNAYGLYIPSIFLFSGVLYIAYVKLMYPSPIIIEGDEEDP
jgi:hypothetical protein